VNGRSAILIVLVIGSIPCAQAQAPAVIPSQASGVPTTSAVVAGVKTYTVPAGTKILLSLKSEISSRVAMPGDPVYLVSDFPVVADGIAVLPAGMYVRGVIDTVQRPGRVKGRAQLQLHFTSIILPNGVQVALPGSLDNAPGSTGAKVKNAEGTVEEAGSKGQDAQRIAQTTTVGAGVGSLAGIGSGDGVKGLGIGAGAGAAVGVLTTLLTRGNDIVFLPGTNLEMVLNRPLVLQENQLAGMTAYTGLAVPVTPSIPQSPSGTPKPN
jgi:type IV secretion system protein VirB10